MASYDAKKEGGITFAAQDKLPKLPIPTLEDTCRRYAEALQPLQTPRERAETQQVIQEFLKNDGPDLQEKLKRYAHGKTSYIEQFCKHSPRDAPFSPLRGLMYYRVRLVPQLRQPSSTESEPLLPPRRRPYSCKE